MNPLNIPSIIRKERKKDTYRKPDSVKLLEQMLADDYHAKHPTLPIVYDKMRDDTANGLTKCIVNYLKLKGHYVTRINSQGTYSHKLGRYIPSTARKGLADIEALINGRLYAIEVKIGRDVQSQHQKDVELDIIKSGGSYFIARDFTSFVQYIEQGLI